VNGNEAIDGRGDRDRKRLRSTGVRFGENFFKLLAMCSFHSV